MISGAELIGLFDAALYNSTGYLFVVLGILVSIRFTGFPDLTADGSFTFGAALYAVGIQSDLPVLLCFILAWTGGLFAGIMTASINRICQIGKILSGILVMLFLITIVPYITGGATVGLLQKFHWLAAVQQWDLQMTRTLWPNVPFSLHMGFTTCIGVMAAGIFCMSGWFFCTRLGLQLRYVGSAESPSLLTESRRKALLFFGLAIGNSLISLGGAIEAERKGGFSQNMGLGVLLIGLACLVLGESVIKTFVRRDHLYVREYLLASIIGVIGYSMVLQLLLLLGLSFIDVRLTTTIFLLVLLTIAAKRHPSTSRLF